MSDKIIKLYDEQSRINKNVNKNCLWESYEITVKFRSFI